MPNMTYKITIALQCFAVFAQGVLPAAAPVFGMTPEQVTLGHSVIAGLQAIQGVLAAARDKYGYKLPPGFSPLKPIEGPKGDVE